jgi:hypothetical protein
MTGTGRHAFLNDESVIVIPVAERQTSVTRGTSETIWTDTTEGGHSVFRLSDGRMVLADRIRLTENLVEIPRKRSVKAVEPEESVVEEPDELPEDSEPEELTELHPPSFSALFDEQAEENSEDSAEEDSVTEVNSPTSEETGFCAP